MVQKNTKILAYVSISLLLLSMVSCAVFVFVISKQKSVYEEESHALAQKNANRAMVRSLMETLEDTKTERTTLLSRIVDEEDVIDLLSRIENLGKAEGVKLTTNALTVESLNESFETLNMSLTVEGSYLAVVRVLALLEHIPYQSTVSKTQIFSEEGVWRGVFQIQVTKTKKI